MAYAEGAAISSLHCPGVRKPVQLYGVPFEKITQTKAKTPHDMGGHQAASWIFGSFMDVGHLVREEMAQTD